MKKYRWKPHRPGDVGFFFNEKARFRGRTLMDDVEPTGDAMQKDGMKYPVFRTTTKSSIHWVEGDPVEPIFFAMCGHGVFFHDENTVGAFREYVNDHHDWQDGLLEFFYHPEE